MSKAESRSRFSAIGRTTVFLLFVVLGLASSSLYAQPAKVLDRVPFELLIDLNWQGQDIQVRKILSCDLRRRTHPGNTPDDPGLKVREIWEQNVNRVSYVLPSKEVLIFIIPDACRTFNGGLGRLVDDFLPITYWLDRLDSPREAEQLRYSHYFAENPYRRFVIKQVRISESKGSKRRIEDDQSLVDLLESRYSPAAYFVGVNAKAFPRSVWSRYPELEKELRGYTQSTAVDRQLLQKTAPLLLHHPCEAEAQGIGPRANCMVGPLDDRPYAVAAKREGDGWAVDYKDVGVRRYVRYVESRDIDSTGCNRSFPICNLYKGTYRVKVGDETFEFPRVGAGVVYDAKNELLVLISFGFVRSGSQSEGR